MTYEWEHEIRDNIDELDDAILDVVGVLPEDCTVIGLVIANTETVEAAVFRVDDFDDIAGADLWKDAMSDAEAEYHKAIEVMRENYSKARIQ